MSPPLEPTDRGYLDDIVAYGERARRHLAGLPLAAFRADEKTQDGVVRCLAIVGEAAWKLTSELKAANPSIPWPLIAGMRHRLVHDYGAVDLATVHRVVSDDLARLISQVREIIARG